jgi:hypothetical protein
VRFLAHAVVAAGCTSAAAPAPAVHNASAPVAASRASEDTCALVAAMLAIDSGPYQELYANRECGVGAALHDPLVVDLQAPVALMSSGTTCPGRRFELFHGERDMPGAIIELRLVPEGAGWRFMATVVEPNPPVNPDGGFDVSTNYCHAMAGVVERTDHGWHASVRPF